MAHPVFPTMTRTLSEDGDNFLHAYWRRDNDASEDPSGGMGSVRAFALWAQYVGATSLQQGERLLRWCVKHGACTQTRSTDPRQPVEPRCWRVVVFDGRDINPETFDEMARSYLAKLAR